jgi:hypothetical protein
LPQGVDGILVPLVDQKAVVPILIDPTLALGLKLSKIDNPAHGILTFAADKEVGNVVMTVKMLTFATVLVESMPSTKFNSSHYGE